MLCQLTHVATMTCMCQSVHLMMLGCMCQFAYIMTMDLMYCRSEKCCVSQSYIMTLYVVERCGVSQHTSLICWSAEGVQLMPSFMCWCCGCCAMGRSCTSCCCATLLGCMYSMTANHHVKSECCDACRTKVCFMRAGFANSRPTCRTSVTSSVGFATMHVCFLCPNQRSCMLTWKKGLQGCQITAVST